MKRKTRNHKNWGLLLFAFLLLSVLPVQKVKAGGGLFVSNNFIRTVVKYDNASRSVGIYEEAIRNVPLKEVKVTSSNKSVATVKNIGWDGQLNYFQLTPKKAGTTNVTITAKANGKKVKLKGKFKIVNYENPFKSFEFNGKSYMSGLKKGRLLEGEGGNACVRVQIKADDPKIKFQYELKSGWEIERCRSSLTINRVPKVSTKIIKSGATFKNPKDKGFLNMTMVLRNKRTNAGLEVYMGTHEMPED